MRVRPAAPAAFDEQRIAGLQEIVADQAFEQIWKRVFAVKFARARQREQRIVYPPLLVSVEQEIFAQQRQSGV